MEKTITFSLPSVATITFRCGANTSSWASIFSLTHYMLVVFLCFLQAVELLMEKKLLKWKKKHEVKLSQASWTKFHLAKLCRSCFRRNARTNSLLSVPFRCLQFRNFAMEILCSIDENVGSWHSPGSVRWISLCWALKVIPNFARADDSRTSRLTANRWASEKIPLFS